jgi:Kelch motif
MRDYAVPLNMIPMLETEYKSRKNSLSQLPPMVEFSNEISYPSSNLWCAYKFEKANPFPRVGHAATMAVGRQGEVYVFGGFAHGERSNDLYVIDSATSGINVEGR